MSQIETFLLTTVAGIEVKHLLLAAAFLAGGYVLRVVSMAVLKQVLHFTSKTDTAVDDILIGALTKPLSAMCFVLGLWAAFEVLPLPDGFGAVERLVRAMIKALTVWIAIWFFLRLIDRATRHMQEAAEETRAPIIEFVPLFRKTAKVILVLIGVVVIFQELGYSVTSLIAGLGLGGLALGLAAKDTLANFFGSVVIFVDRPFARGDWIKVADQEGIVEDIGVRVTRIRTFTDSLITVPNSLLTTTAITNFSVMRKRRILFELNLALDVSPDKVETAVASIRKLILADSRIHPDPVVYFKAIADYSLKIQVACFAATADYSVYMTTQQDLLLNILRLLGELDMALVYPTQQVNYTGEAGSPPASPTRTLPA